MNAHKFGICLRCARLGFHWSDQHRCYIRMSDASNGRFRVDINPADKLPNGSDKVGEFYCWWEGADDDRARMLDLCEPLKAIAESGVAPKTKAIFYVGDDGRIL